MKNHTKQQIKHATIAVFSREGYDGLSMRRLASEIGVSVSVVYYYFPDKDTLLEQIFDEVRRDLGRKRAQMDSTNTSVESRIEMQIRFQFAHAEEIVFVYRYFLRYRTKFMRNTSGFLPPRAHRHFQEILHESMGSDESETVSKFLTHAINGYVLEYFPNIEDSDIDNLCSELTHLALRTARKKEVAM